MSIARFILRNSDILANCIKFISELNDDKLYEVVIQVYKSKRSIYQNSLYWLWLSEIAEQATTIDGQRLNKEEWHYLCRLKFLGVKKLEIAGNEYRLPVKSTTELNVSDFSEYLLNIESEFLQKGVILTFPDYYENAIK